MNKPEPLIELKIFTTINFVLEDQIRQSTPNDMLRDVVRLTYNQLSPSHSYLRHVITDGLENVFQTI